MEDIRNCVGLVIKWERYVFLTIVLVIFELPAETVRELMVCSTHSVHFRYCCAFLVILC